MSPKTTKKGDQQRAIREPGSFRDPSGHIFYDDGRVYRQVNQVYAQDWQALQESGLLDALHNQKLLISHQERPKQVKEEGVVTVLEVAKVPFISYPYEWSFSQLKDAALLTLQIQRLALEKGMVLKDASAYNVQFIDGRPVFIDTLSFTQYKPGDPWVAYQQFCQHFLAPLALMALVDVGLQELLRTNIDGIPLPLASKLLPKTSFLNLHLATHLHLHARNQRSYADSDKKPTQPQKIQISRQALMGILDSLETGIRGLEWQPKGTEWGEYYTFTNYSDASFKRKRSLVKTYIEKTKPDSVLDIGANNGEFSRVASELGIPTVASDIDPVAVEKNYRQIRQGGEQNLLPLIMDLTNPSPSLGWAHQERQSFAERGPVDVVMALALIHHLAISNNLPFSHIAQYCATLGRHLIIEFVPKEDSQVQKLLRTREDIFDSYSGSDFERDFSQHFKLLDKQLIRGSKRTLYLWKRKQ